MEKISIIVAALAVLLFGGYVIHAADADKDPVVAKYKTKLEYAKKQYLAAVDKIKQAMAKDYKRLRDAAMARKDLDLANKYQAKINALTAKDVQESGDAAPPDADKDKSEVDLDVGIPGDPTRPEASKENWKILEKCSLSDEGGNLEFSAERKKAGNAYFDRDLGKNYRISGKFKIPEGSSGSFMLYNAATENRILVFLLGEGDGVAVQARIFGKKRKLHRRNIKNDSFDWGKKGQWSEFALTKRGRKLSFSVGKAKISVDLEDNDDMPYFGVSFKNSFELRDIDISKK